MSRNKDYYIHALMIAVPIMIQNGITNFVNMLDNIMVGQVGTDPMSGVAVVNQLMFVFNLCIFGGLSGIGIFTAQFHGRGDEEGVRNTFRLMCILAFLLVGAGLIVFLTLNPQLISLYLTEDGGAGNIAETFRFAQQYLFIMLAGLIPFAAAQVYAGTLRYTGDTVVPMRASMVAVFLNLIGNYVLIYGKFGFPQMGVAGAALATVISRYAEMFLLIFHTHRNPDRYPFIQGVYRTFRVPMSLTKQCIRKGMPLLVNEALWSSGQATLIQNYSVRGLSVVAAMNISSTISNLFSVAFISMGSAIGIVIGQELGAGKLSTAKQNANSLTVFSVLLSSLFAAALFAAAPVFPGIYNTSPEIQELATGLIRVVAVCMPIHSYCNCAYFVLRSGGKTLITFFFDSCYSWLIPIPAAFLLSRFTSIPVIQMYLYVQLLDLIKCVIGYILLERGSWINNMTETV